MADGTGFSSPSVESLLRDWKDHSVESDWKADTLFPRTGAPSATLVEALRSLGGIPEIHLGTDLEGDFSPEKAARIVTGWVNGVSLSRIADDEFGGDLLECCRHVFSVLSNVVPWGLGAIERVGFAGKTVDWKSLNTVPAMVFHGVKSPAAVGLRMVGVPRFVAEGLASQAMEHGVKLSALRDWLDGVPDASWAAALPPGAKLSGGECKRLWRILDGRERWPTSAAPRS